MGLGLGVAGALLGGGVHETVIYDNGCGTDIIFDF
jgi:hypothetical protein